MQSGNGGFGAFDADNTHYYLNNIPFADHGALLDPPTEDVTGRCVSMLAQLGERADENADVDRAIDYLRDTQLADGSWYGRWGMNYIYGTWSVLCALNAAGLDPQSDLMRKAADWLIAIQNPDGGWGEDGTSYKLDYRGYEAAPSTASQTAWALLGLMAAGRTDHPAVAARHRLSCRDPGGRRLLERAALHRHRIPAGVLPALSRLPPVLPAVGAGALSQSAGDQQRRRCLRDVSQARPLPAASRQDRIATLPRYLIFPVSLEDSGLWPPRGRVRGGSPGPSCPGIEQICRSSAQRRGEGCGFAISA